MSRERLARFFNFLVSGTVHVALLGPLALTILVVCVVPPLN